MLKLSNRISFCWTVSICVYLASVVDGQGQCNCQCSLPFYGRTNVCGLLRDLSPKIDSNKNEIDKLLEFKESVERRMNQGAAHFERLTDKQPQEDSPSPIAESPRDKLDYNTLLQEIEKMKKKFDEEINAKIATAQSYFLRENEKLSARVNSAEDRSLKVDAEILEKINRDGNQTLKMKNELSGKIQENENSLSNFRSEVFVKIKEVEDKTSKDKSELLVRIYETANRNFEVKDKVNEVERNSLQERNKLSAEVREMKNTMTKNLEKEQADRSYLEGTLSKTEDMMKTVMSAQEQTLKKADFDKIAENLTQYIYFVYLGSLYDKVDALEKEKYLELDSRVESLETRVQNFSSLRESFLDHDENIQTLFSVFNSFKEEIEPTVQELERKAVQVEGILEKMPQSGNQQLLDEIGNSVKHLQLGASSDEPELDSSLIYKGFGIEKCGNVQLAPNNARSLSKNACSITIGPDGKQKGTLSQVLVALRQKRHGEPEYKNHCFAIVISDHWAVTTTNCIDLDKNTYALAIEDSRNLSRPAEVESINIPFYHKDYVAFLSTKKSFNYDHRMDYFPACIPTEKIREKVLVTATFVAWGPLKQSNLFSALSQTEVCVITDAECIKIYSTRKELGPSPNHLFLCTQYNAEAQQSCMEGGGGMLLKEIENKVVLIAFTFDCGEPGKPIVYREMSYITNDIDWAVRNT